MGEVEGQVRSEQLDAEREARRRAALAQIRQYPDPALRIRAGEVDEIDETVAGLRSETAVRDVVDALNDRILDSHRRRVDGPPVVTAKLDVDAVVARWRERRNAC